jgi:hypothetical protein
MLLKHFGVFLDLSNEFVHNLLLMLFLLLLWMVELGAFV